MSATNGPHGPSYPDTGTQLDLLVDAPHVLPRPKHPDTLVRTTDPDTSRMAAWSIGDATKVQRRIIDLLTEHGRMSDEGLSAAYRLRYGPAGQSSIRSRRHDLTGHGIIVKAGTTPLLSGRLGTVWRLA